MYECIFFFFFLGGERGNEKKIGKEKEEKEKAHIIQKRGAIRICLTPLPDNRWPKAYICIKTLRELLGPRLTRKLHFGGMRHCKLSRVEDDILVHVQNHAVQACKRAFPFKQPAEAVAKDDLPVVAVATDDVERLRAPGDHGGRVEGGHARLIDKAVERHYVLVSGLRKER